MRRIIITTALIALPFTAYAQDNEATLHRLATVEAAEMIAEACPNVFVNLAKSEAEEDAVFSEAQSRLGATEEDLINSLSDPALTQDLSNRAAGMITALFGENPDLKQACATAEASAGRQGPYAFITTEPYESQEARDQE